MRKFSMIRRALAPSVAVVLMLAGCGASPRASAAYDVVLRGGTVYDGSGAPGRRADVGIRGDRIAAIGELDNAEAELSLDVSGLAIAPGFINAHSWATGSLLRDGRSLSDLKQGVTTEVFGEGVTMGPLNDALRERLETEYDPDFPPPGYPIRWTTLYEYLRHMEEKGITPNVASLVGATTLRQYVIGDEDRPPTADELDRMRDLVDVELRNGALGVGSRLAYAPASYASSRELVALAEVASRHGGLYMSHIRSEGAGLIEAVDEFLGIARQADLRATIYHLKAAGAENWGKMDSVLATVNRARAEGLSVTATVYPYVAGSTGLDASIPHWAHEGGPDSLRARLRDAATRRRIAATVYFLMAEENLVTELREPWVMLGSDAPSIAAEGEFLASSVHPRAYGTFARFLGRYVRDQEVMPLEEAIRRITSLPADHLGLVDRGRVQTGFYADLVVFDPARVRDHATFESPHRYASGVRHVFVNGEPVLRDGEHTGRYPGRALLRRTGDAAAN